MPIAKAKGTGPGVMQPVATGSAASEGDVALSNNLIGILQKVDAGTGVAKMLTDSTYVEVTKLAGAAWVAGEPIFFDVTAGSFTNVEGTLPCVGYASDAATSAAVVGYIDFSGKPQAGNGRAIRMGSAAVTGSLANIDTGLTLIEFAFAITKIAAQGANTSGYVTLDHGADGLLDLYCWDDAGAAASVAATVYWIAFGTQKLPT